MKKVLMRVFNLILLLSLISSPLCAFSAVGGKGYLCWKKVQDSSLIKKSCSAQILEEWGSMLNVDVLTCSNYVKESFDGDLILVDEPEPIAGEPIWIHEAEFMTTTCQDIVD